MPAALGVPTVDRIVALAQKVPVFPCSRDKKPLVKHGFHAASQDASQIRRWWSQWPDALIGVPTGQRTGIIVIDYDANKASQATTRWVENNAEILASTRTHHTQSGEGRHWLFRTTDRYATGTNLEIQGSRLNGLDLRANGGYVIWWPAHGLQASDDEIARLPAGLMDDRRVDVRRLMEPLPAAQPAEWAKERERVIDALRTLEAVGYEHWIRIGMAIHEASGGSDDGFSVWHDWSATSPSYDDIEDCQYHWRSFGGYASRRTTLGTLYKAAQEAGWRPADSPTVMTTVRRIAPTSDERAAERAERPFLETALAAALDESTSEWLLRPYLERDVLCLLYGDYGTLKSFQVLDWSLRVALGMPAIGQEFKRDAADVVYISAEGKGLWKRLRAWCVHHLPDEDWQDVLARARLHVIRRPVNLSDAGEILFFANEIDKLGITPALIGIDTLSRNSDGEPEKSTDSATRYLNQIDQGLRARYRCSVVFVHHCGHAEKGRHRGPIVLAANTDAEFRITRPDAEQLTVALEVVRLKDSESPPAVGLKGVVVDLGGFDEDGNPVTSLALAGTDEVPQTRKSEPGGKAQQVLINELRRLQREAGETTLIWPIGELRSIARNLGQHRNTAIRAVDGLVVNGFVTATVGGNRLSDGVL